MAYLHYRLPSKAINSYLIVFVTLFLCSDMQVVILNIDLFSNYQILYYKTFIVVYFLLLFVFYYLKKSNISNI